MDHPDPRSIVRARGVGRGAGGGGGGGGGAKWGEALTLNERECRV